MEENIQKLEELFEKKKQLNNEISRINAEIKQVTIMDYDDKYIFIEGKGYMKVYSNYYSLNDSNISFYGTAIEYDDDAYLEQFKLSMEGEWCFDILKFMHLLNDGKVTVITKEEFENRTRSIIDEYVKKFYENI